MEGFLGENMDVLRINLSPAEMAQKRKLFEWFETQQHVLKWFPVAVEKFRIAPDYRFTKRPHAGQLYYEMFPWGMDGNRWCELAYAAEEELARSEFAHT